MADMMQPSITPEKWMVGEMNGCGDFRLITHDAEGI